MELLVKNKIMSRKELSEWFGIKESSFSLYKDRKLEELSEYCDYDLITTPSGKFKAVVIKEVMCNEYQRKLGAKVKAWLESGDRWAETADQGVSSASILTNYYCEQNGIEYDGCHYVWEEVTGTEDGDRNRKIKQNKKVPNEEFKTWHYIYGIITRYYKKNNNRVDSLIYDLSTDKWNPVKATLTTEEMKEKRMAISKWFYGQKEDIYDDAMRLVDFLTAEEEAEVDMIQISKTQLHQYELVAKLTDKQRRAAIASAQKEAGVLRREGVKRES